MLTSHRSNSRVRFEKYKHDRHNKRNAPDPRKSKPPGSEGLDRSLLRLLGELWRVLHGHRRAIVAALALLSVATLLKMVPPASTKFVIDYVLTSKPLPPSAPPTFATMSPRSRLFVLVAIVLVVSLVRVFVSLCSRWIATRTTKRVQMEMRRRAFAHAARLPLHRVYGLKSGGAASLLREDAGGIGELVFSMLYNPWSAIVQLARRTRRARVGRLAAARPLGRRACR